MDIEEQEGGTSFVHFKVKKEISKNKSHPPKLSKSQSKKNEQGQEKRSKETNKNNGLESKLKVVDLQKQSSINQVVPENEEQEENKPKENIKIVDMDIIPIVRHLKMQTVYMLSGDVMVDLDFGMKEDEHPICQISAINSFKNPIRVQVLKEYMSNEVDLTNSQDSLKEFSKIIEILEHYPDKYAHDFGKVLRQYQIFVTGQLKKAEFLKHNQDFRSLIPTFDSQFEDFLIDARQYLKNNIQKNKFQFYMIVKSNINTFTHDISRFGLSEGLCQLLGGNGDQIGALILRRGLFEFFSKETRNNFYFYYLSNLLNVKDVSIERSISLVTLDGIELKVDYEMENYFGKNKEPNVLFFYPFMLIMITFDVKPYMVKQVLNIRSSLDNETQQFMREFEEDVYYSLESQIFLESYYAEYYQKIVDNNGQGLPKEKRKYKKHPQTKHQLDFRQQNQSVLQSTKQQKKTSNSLTTSESSHNQLNGHSSSSIDDLNQLQQNSNQQLNNSDGQFDNQQDNNDNIMNEEDDMKDEKNSASEQSIYQQYKQNINYNHQNQFPYVSQNFTNYENLDVQNFSQKQTTPYEKDQIPKYQQKIQVQENICIYQSSQYAANPQKFDISKLSNEELPYTPQPEELLYNQSQHTEQNSNLINSNLLSANQSLLISDQQQSFQNNTITSYNNNYYNNFTQ